MKKFRNLLYFSLSIILILNFIFLGFDSIISVFESSLVFLVFLPLLIFIQFFPKIISFKKEVPLELVYETVVGKKINFNRKTIILIIILFLGTDYLFGGINELLNSLFNYWVFSVCAWLILLSSYSYQVYINNPTDADN